MTISVVIPTYARPALLETTLTSVIRQTHADLEVLVCDNADDDRVAALIERLADARIRHIRREHNLGMQRNLLLGFAAARGDYLFKLDDDDLPAPEALERLHAALQQHPAASVAFGRLLEFHEREAARATPCSAALPAGITTDFGDLAATGRMSLAASLIRRSAFERIQVDPRSATAYDLDILLRLDDDGAIAVHVPEAEVHYRRHDAADSVLAPVRQGLGALAVLDAARARRSPDLPLSPGFTIAYETAALLAARGLLRNGEGKRAREVLRSLPAQIDSRPIRRLRAATRLPRLARPVARLAHLIYQRKLTRSGARTSEPTAGTAPSPAPSDYERLV